MDNNLITINNKEVAVIDSREIAEMMGKTHAELLKDIDGRKDKKGVGVIPTLKKGNFHLSNYFIESTYKSGTREYKCYLVTKMGCELLGNKQQGEKGILFTAKYVERFNQMEQRLKEISDRDRLLLGLFSEDKMVVAESHKALVELEVREATKPLLHKIEEDEPKVMFAETALKSADNILVRELAKIATNEGIKLGQNQLYEKLREWKYIMKGKTEPYQSAVDKGYFVVEEKSVKTPYGVKLTQTTKVTPLGQIKIIEKLRKEI